MDLDDDDNSGFLYWDDDDLLGWQVGKSGWRLRAKLCKQILWKGHNSLEFASLTRQTHSFQVDTEMEI